MTDRATVVAFVDAYVNAWGSNDPADLRAAFTEDVEYRFTPFDEPARGIDELIAQWLNGRDEPGDFHFRWEVVAVDGDTAVIRARTRYVAGTAAGRDYSNLWVVTLAADGRASTFTEWWMEEPGAPPDEAADGDPSN